MGSIITIATSKGGGGKTALATCLAANLAALGYAVHVIDADRNEAFARWHRGYVGPQLICESEIDHTRIVGLARDRAGRNDVVLIDPAGFENQTSVFAMAASDLVLIPCMADRNSVVEAIRTARQADSLGQIARRDIPYRVVLTRWHPGRLAERATLDDLAAAKLPTLRQYVGDLADLAKLTFSGVVPLSGALATQIDRMIGELSDIQAIPARRARRGKQGSRESLASQDTATA
jgi:chromosome partitioning protein